MPFVFLAANGGGSGLPVWGQIVFAAVWLVIGVFVVRGLIRRRRQQR